MVEGKQRVGMGCEKLAKRHRHHHHHSRDCRAERYGTRRDETTPKTQPHTPSCFSQYYTKVHTSLLPAKHIIFHPFICPCSLQCWAAA